MGGDGSLERGIVLMGSYLIMLMGRAVRARVKV
jgi:hypothetical protein